MKFFLHDIFFIFIRKLNASNYDIRGFADTSFRVMCCKIFTFYLQSWSPLKTTKLQPELIEWFNTNWIKYNKLCTWQLYWIST